MVGVDMGGNGLDPASLQPRDSPLAASAARPCPCHAGAIIQATSAARPQR